MSKPTLFVVLDIETTLRKRIAFDVAWTITDRKGGDFGSGSFVIREAFALQCGFRFYLVAAYLACYYWRRFGSVP